MTLRQIITFKGWADGWIYESEYSNEIVEVDENAILYPDWDWVEKLKLYENEDVLITAKYYDDENYIGESNIWMSELNEVKND